MAEQQFQAFVEAVEQAFDQAVEEGSDQQLFISSYLSGHFSLVVANALNAKEHCLQSLNDKMQSSLAMAFANKELEGGDQDQVRALWAQLFHQFA
ncbi:YfcL family protein [Aliiglaciecola sp. CAU 1673]|uniref:YfcL family protein n=1 Tax=Aliiglaciecola sp. CAU 1673 TaxID=3032595 RepID=UPI0023DB1080|nr:YfcL family protein [Aliiglaciecola sp. CAU 1673]MDF2178043.1 YfcL family protein [Aliiglaciecola sp. CAU 1673]